MISSELGVSDTEASVAKFLRAVAATEVAANPDLVAVDVVLALVPDLDHDPDVTVSDAPSTTNQPTKSMVPLKKRNGASKLIICLLAAAGKI